MAEKTIEGGCLCGAIRYQVSGEPYHITHCHCEDCRRSAGAAFVTWASFLRENFRVTRGEMRAVSFAGRLRFFCPQCGSSLAFQFSPQSEEIDLTVSCFDHPELISPADHVWVEDRLPWIKLSDGLPVHARYRPEDPFGQRDD